MKIQNILLPAAFLVALGSSSTTAAAQDRYMTRTGHIAFHSATSVERIEADNHKVTSVWDATSGAIEFAVLIKAFEFEKALMQEHFNENYMESNTFPKAAFKGKLTGITAEQVKQPGRYDVIVEGELTIHGVTKPMKSKGTVVVDASGAVKASSAFAVKPEDHGIKIPGMVRKNIAEEIQVQVSLDYQKM
ncbi:MAG: YceI family protein [Flavobacteriales bacterium]|nr:YceI family protein [Flavobacteriales bacterium]